MRVGLPHLGQSVLLEVSITFLRSAVFAIFTVVLSWQSPHGPQPWANQISSRILEAIQTLACSSRDTDRDSTFNIT